MKRRILPSILLAGVLAVAFGIIWAFAGLCITTIYQGWKHEPSIRREAIVYRDGSAAVKTTTYLPGDRYATEDEVITPVHDPMVEAPDDAVDPAVQEALGRMPINGCHIGVRHSDLPVYPWWRYDRGTSDGKKTPTFWYFVYEPRRESLGHFEGYDSMTNRRVGYLTLDGFQTEEPTDAQRFRVDPRLGVLWEAPSYVEQRAFIARGGTRPWGYLIADGAVYRVDLADRTVNKIIESEGIETIAHGYEAVEDGFRGRIAPILFVRKADRVLKIRPDDGNRLGVFPIPEPLRDKSFVHYALRDNLSVLKAGNFRRPDRLVTFRFYWLNESGDILDQERVDYPSGAGQQNQMLMVGTVCGGVPAPAVTIPFTAIALPLQLVKQKEADNWRGGFLKMLAFAWHALLGLTAFSGLLAWLTVRRQRRYGDDHPWAWAVFVFLFGLPGFVGYLVHRQWPVIEACPSCEAAAPRDREMCSHCSAPFPTQEMKGTEVFA